MTSESSKAEKAKKVNRGGDKGAREPLIYLHILKMLGKNEDLTVKVIQSRLQELGFERSDRQIQRIMQTLCDQFDIVCNSQSKPYGYRWKREAVGLSVNKLSASESLILALAKKHLENFLPSKLAGQVDQMFNAAGYNLRHGSGNKLAKQWLNKIHTTSQNLPLLPPKYMPGVFDVISDALYQNQILEVTYRKLGGETKTRQVEPWGLVRQGVRLYLVCRYLKYPDPVSIAIHRIKEIENTNHIFDYPEDFDLRQFDLEGRLNYGKGQLTEVKIWMDKRLSRQFEETKLSDDQKIEEADNDGVIITANLYDSLRLERWLNGFGERARLIGKTPIERRASHRTSI